MDEKKKNKLIKVSNSWLLLVTLRFCLQIFYGQRGYIHPDEVNN
jgi:hypothetical protein